MAECLIEIGKAIITQCLWPAIKTLFGYWWCFDNNIQVLKDGVEDLKRKKKDMDTDIECGERCTHIPRVEVQEWSKAATEKLEEAARILEDDINPKAWNLISRYSIGKRVKKASEAITKHLNDGNKFNVVADPAPPPSMRSTPHESSMYFVSRERIEEDIIKSLKKSSVSMIGIWGMGGVGKTTMARRIRKKVIEEKLFEEVVMVVVSQEMDMPKIQEEIAELFGLDFTGIQTFPARASRLNTRLKDAKRKLIIFDDVWESLELTDLGVTFERCKILLTTRDKVVCKRMEAQEIITIKILTEEEAWKLFKENAGDRVEDSVLRGMAKEVVAECKGLPIALVTVGRALKDAQIEIWRHSLSQLRQANPDDFPDVLKYVYKPLRLSYDKLDNKSEQLLFLLCCLFPDDYNIPMEELTLYFMGLRIFDNITSIEETRDGIYTLVEKLKSRFLLINGKNDFHVKMHDVVRDVAIHIGKTEKDCLVKSLNKISTKTSSDSNCNWMSVDDSNEPMKVDMGLRFPKLCLLMLKHLRSDISLDGIIDLNVLSFSNISIGSLPPMPAFLQNLRTLYLYRCAVEDISVIGKLEALEILYCHYCDKIKELPAEIGTLYSLRLLDLNACHILERIPFDNLSSLRQLEELKILRLEELTIFRTFYGWEADENGKEMMNASVREPESLPNLTCLEIQISDSNLAAQEICLLSQKLVKYNIHIGSAYCWSEERDYEKAMYLYLPSDIGAVGKWIQILVKDTEYLRLEGDGSNNFNLEECLDLRILKVRNCSTLKKLVNTKDCKSGSVFPMLEILELEYLENIKEIWDGTIIPNQNVSSLCNLKYLIIDRCSKLRYLFSVSVATTCLLQLEVLKITNCKAMEQVFWNDITVGCIEFPKLKELILHNLRNLTAFCQGLQTINFPNLTEKWIGKLPKLKSFCPLNSERDNHDTNSFHSLFNPKVLQVKILTEEEAWNLFKEKAGDRVKDSDLRDVAKKVVSECKGLPIALVTVGKALQNQGIRTWRDSLYQLRQANPDDLPEVLKDVYNPLRLSYDTLDNKRVQLLFLLCCLFPEDYNIPMEELTSYFMGLRISENITSIEGTRDVINYLVEKLKSRFLLIDGKDDFHVKMHDVVRDVAIYIGSKEKDCLVKSLNKISTENSSDINCNWMSVDVSNEPMNVGIGLRFPKLRLLKLKDLCSDTSLKGIRDLNVLSFSYISIGSLPQTLAFLQNLRTLYLYHCKVEDISVIGELAALETLYCHYCDRIEELPAEIGTLNHLRLLELNECRRLQRIPFGILSSLVWLEELKILKSFYGWEADENGKDMRNASVRELESLPNLTCLEIQISDFGLAVQEIRLPPNLVKYNISIGFEKYRYVSRDYEKAMKLRLPSGIGAVGKWIQILVKNTEFLDLQGDGSNNFNLEECQNLCSTLKKLVKTKYCESAIVFPMLERLELRELENIEEIWDGTIILNQNVSSLCNLKYLIIKRCSNLRYLFSVSVATACLLQLEVLQIENCEAMEQVFMNDVTDGCIEFPKLKELKLTNCSTLKKLAKTKDRKSGIVFPMLERLELMELENIEEIWDGSLCNLKSVHISDCPKLRYLFSVSEAITCLLQLEVLQIENCKAMKQVFRNAVTVEFPKLKKLILFNCSTLKKLVKTKDCKSGIVFPLLETLELKYLDNLEEICDGTIILNQNVSSLGNLKYLIIYSCSNLRYLFSVSVATTTCLLQLEVLRIQRCEAMEQVFRNDVMDGCIEFPKLNELELSGLPNLTAFSQGLQTVKFPILTQMKIGDLPKLNSFCPLNSKAGNHDTNSFHFLCNPKVEIGCLKTLTFWGYNYNNNMNILCHQIPINFFNNLQKLRIWFADAIRSLMSYSIAKNFVSLEELTVGRCDEMVEVIEGNDADKEIDDIKSLFPILKKLDLEALPKLRRFWQWNHALELPLLEEVIIDRCPEMETFTLGSLNTPNLKRLEINDRTMDDMKDLNDIPRHYFRTEEDD